MANIPITTVSVTIRNLDSTVKYRLRVRAAQNGRSLEAELRAIVTEAVDAPTRPLELNVYNRIPARFEPLGGVDLEVLARKAAREPPAFDDTFARHKRLSETMKPYSDAAVATELRAQPLCSHARPRSTRLRSSPASSFVPRAAVAATSKRWQMRCSAKISRVAFFPSARKLRRPTQTCSSCAGRKTVRSHPLISLLRPYREPMTLRSLYETSGSSSCGLTLINP